MTEPVLITGIGCWTGLGNLDQSWKQLQNGYSSIWQQQPFPELASYPLCLLQNTPTFIPTITQQVVEMALSDAQLSPPLADCGVVIGSSRGCQGAWEQWAQGKESLNWLEMLPNQGAMTAAQMVGATEAVLSPMAACSTGIWSIAQGYHLIQSGQCQQVIAGAVESPITPLTLTGFAKMGALASTGCYPFDQQREGLVLGEGGAVFVLESLQSAQKRKANHYGQVLGFGLSCDAYHVSAPDPNDSAGRGAVKKALQRSGLCSNQIDYIHAHGTSTSLNDAREAQLIQELFSPSVAVSSTKGATGHTLGASSAIGVAFTLMALQQQILPPCVGLTNPAFPLNLVSSAIAHPINYSLCLSFGFGGQNGAIILGH